MLFKRKEYAIDEIKINIKRFHKEIKELENKLIISLMKEHELLLKPSTFKDWFIIQEKYGRSKDIKFDIKCKYDNIRKSKNIIEERNTIIRS